MLVYILVRVVCISFILKICHMVILLCCTWGEHYFFFFTSDNLNLTRLKVFGPHHSSYQIPPFIRVRVVWCWLSGLNRCHKNRKRIPQNRGIKHKSIFWRRRKYENGAPAIFHKSAPVLLNQNWNFINISFLQILISSFVILEIHKILHFYFICNM